MTTRYSLPGVLSLLALALFITSACADVQYSIAPLGTLGGNFSSARGLNPNGQAVGFSSTPSGQIHAFLYADGHMTDLGSLDAPSSCASAINISRQVVGYSAADSAGASVRPFLYQSGTITPLGTLGGPNAHAQSINTSGLIVGSSATFSGDTRAFLCNSGLMIDLGALPGYRNSSASSVNNYGHVVGYSFNSDGRSRAFFYANGVISELPPLAPGKDSTAAALNDADQVVGHAVNDSNQTHAFLYSDGVTTDLGVLSNGVASFARGVDSRGRVVGSCHTYAGDRAFLYRDGVMIDLNDLIVSSTGWCLTNAVSINDAGQILGEGINPDGIREAFILNPEATALFTAASGPSDPNQIPASVYMPPAYPDLVDFPALSISNSGGYSYTPPTDPIYPPDPIPPAQETPEPASLFLLGTGALGLAGVLRKRFMN